MSITASVYKKGFLQKRTVLAVVERLFWQLGTHFSGRCRCREVAVVERFKQELMYGLSAGTKKCGCCREMAVVERWPLVEVRLYIFINHLGDSRPQNKENLLMWVFLVQWVLQVGKGKEVDNSIEFDSILFTLITTKYNTFYSKKK